MLLCWINSVNMNREKKEKWKKKEKKIDEFRPKQFCVFWRFLSFVFFSINLNGIIQPTEPEFAGTRATFSLKILISYCNASQCHTLSYLIRGFSIFQFQHSTCQVTSSSSLLLRCCLIALVPPPNNNGGVGNTVGGRVEERIKRLVLNYMCWSILTPAQLADSLSRS